MTQSNDEKQKTPGVKTDCFAYSKQFKSCQALKRTYCSTESCSFYKPRKDVKTDVTPS